MKRFIIIIILSLVSILSYGQEITLEQAYPDSICVNGIVLHKGQPDPIIGKVLNTFSNGSRLVEKHPICCEHIRWEDDTKHLGDIYYYALDEIYPYETEYKDGVIRLAKKIVKRIDTKTYRISGYGLGVYWTGSYYNSRKKYITGIFIYVENIEYSKQLSYKRMMRKKTAADERREKINKLDEFINSL